MTDGSLLSPDWYRRKFPMTKLRPVIGTHRALSSGTRSSDTGMDSGGTDRTSHLPLFSADESGGLHSSTSGHIPPSLLRDMQTGPPRSEDLCSRLGTNLLSIFFFSPDSVHNCRGAALDYGISLVLPARPNHRMGRSICVVSVDIEGAQGSRLESILLPPSLQLCPDISQTVTDRQTNRGGLWRGS